MIKDLEEVALARPLPLHGLEIGNVGTVVMVHGGGKGYSVEFMTFAGNNSRRRHFASRGRPADCRARDRPRA